MGKVIKFYAPWCGPCKAINLALENADMTLESYNVDEDMEQAQKYRVMKVPTFLALADDGSVLDRISPTEASEALEFVKKWHI